MDHSLFAHPIQFDPSHNADIIDYYYTNYSNCPKDTCYFATWQFLAIATHSVNIVQVPLAILTGYCILEKTPKAMGSLKWAMLNVHVWSVLVDFLLCTLVTPYVFFPAYSGFSIGLLQVLKVPTSVQCYIGVVSIGFMLNSIVNLFENRSDSFKSNRFRINNKAARMALSVLGGTVTGILLIPLFLNLPDQDAAKLSVLKTIVCPTEEFFTTSIFILIIEPFWNTYFVAVMFLLGMWLACSITLSIGCIVYNMYYLDQSVYSNKTRNLQKMFFIGNLVQISLPAVFWAFPGLVQYQMFFFNYYNQSLTNISFAFVALHGVVAMMVTLLIHQPYRRFLLMRFTGIFRSKNRINTIA